MKNSDLEMRKIPSLDFQYEINENGTIFRNVKSKKQYRIGIYEQKLRGKIYKLCIVYFRYKNKQMHLYIPRLVAECWLGEIPDHAYVKHRDGNVLNNHYTNLYYTDCPKKGIHTVIDGKEFESLNEASKYLASKINSDRRCIYKRLCKRRSHILGYDIKYLSHCRD